MNRNETVIALHKQGKTQAEIADLIGISRSNVGKILRDNGIKAFDRKKKICSCGANIPTEYRFCPFCGKKILTEEELHVKNLTELYQFGVFVPDEKKEYFRNTLRGAIDFIKKGSKR